MQIHLLNPVSHASEKVSSAAVSGSVGVDFQNILRNKMMNSNGSIIFPGEPAKGMKLFGKTSKQSLSDRERIIMQAKGQEATRWLAKRFGMPEGFMNLILQQLGIDAEDLVNPETKDIALKAIMEYFDLSEDEQRFLMEDFNFFMERFDF